MYTLQNIDRYLFKKKKKKICENRLRTIFLKKIDCEKKKTLISFLFTYSFKIHNLILLISIALQTFSLRYFSETKNVELSWNLTSGFERSIAVQGLKKEIRVKVLKSDLTVLRELGQKLKVVQKTISRSRYENLLGLLEVEVQKPVITVLAQYYDPPLRCFTFCDFCQHSILSG